MDLIFGGFHLFETSWCGDIAGDAAAAEFTMRRTRRRSVSWSARLLADAPKGGEGRITEDGRAVCDQGRRPILADGARRRACRATTRLNDLRCEACTKWPRHVQSCIII